jgi:hypothetical protein
MGEGLGGQSSLDQGGQNWVEAHSRKDSVGCLCHQPLVWGSQPKATLRWKEEVQRAEGGSHLQSGPCQEPCSRKEAW